MTMLAGLKTYISRLTSYLVQIIQCIGQIEGIREKAAGIVLDEATCNNALMSLRGSRTR